jgi:hypothetical protein
VCCYLVEVQFYTLVDSSALHGTSNKPSSANSFSFAPSFKIGKDVVDYLYLFLVFTKKTPWAMCSCQAPRNQRFETSIQCKDSVDLHVVPLQNMVFGCEDEWWHEYRGGNKIESTIFLWCWNGLGLNLHHASLRGNACPHQICIGMILLCMWFHHFCENVLCWIILHVGSGEEIHSWALQGLLGPPWKYF